MEYIKLAKCQNQHNHGVRPHNFGIFIGSARTCRQ